MILVVGPGRCGTSSVARILHENGVSMGHLMNRADRYNPAGYYEDMELLEVNRAFFRGKINEDTFVFMVRNILDNRYEPWGLKDTRLCHLLPFYLPLLANPRFIRCRRPKEDIIKSMMRSLSWSEEKARKNVETAEGKLDLYLTGKDVLEVNIGEYEQILPWLHNGKYSLGGESRQ